MQACCGRANDDVGSGFCCSFFEAEDFPSDVSVKVIPSVQSRIQNMLCKPVPRTCIFLMHAYFLGTCIYSLGMHT